MGMLVFEIKLKQCRSCSDVLEHAVFFKFHAIISFMNML
jgi:hypothetical protein